MERNEIIARFEALSPWVYKFRIAGAEYGGSVSALGDARLDQFFNFVARPRRILELGSLEGAHTIQLAARAGVEEVVAIEGRAANIVKAELVRRALRVSNIRFVQANLEETDLTLFGKFDAVFCVGLLYHLPEPWKLIAQLPRIAPRLFVWTHYADDLNANEIRGNYRGLIHHEGGPDEPLSGMSETAFWPTLDSLREMLRASGYDQIEILKNDVTHPNARAVTLTASVPARNASHSDAGAA
ncbi:MAG: class I SAM-dependent methyltransferase [Chthoniobacterales bacterium]